MLEATVYRLLKAHGLIADPVYVVVMAANEFQTKITRPKEMWPTDFTCFKFIGWDDHVEVLAPTELKELMPEARLSWPALP